MWGNITIAFLLAFITSFVITPYTMRLAHKVGAIDFPGERKIHNKPIPSKIYSMNEIRNRKARNIKQTRN